MKRLIISVVILSLYGCTSAAIKDAEPEHASAQIQSAPSVQCAGNVDLPVQLADQFMAVEDTRLLSSALGKADQGMLCQGLVYVPKRGANIPVYRAWNSTNPNSKFGNWWAFGWPSGKVSKYRSDYEICYQWSPLDKMIQCTLKSNVKVVVGTGQSAMCSQYLTYPTSAEKQIYIENASASVLNCTTYDAEFSWRETAD